MKILVIFTGGTIGSSVNGEYISLDGNENKYRLIEKYRQMTNDSQSFEVLQLYNILSENIEGSHITQLMECVNENLNKDYDGIIVTHGTDTVQYTASALTYAFGMNTIPVMLVTSQKVLDASDANGVVNFKYAVEFVRQRCGKGTYVSYKNNEQPPAIHAGSQLLPHQAFKDDMYSVKNNYYGVFDREIFKKNMLYKEEIINKTGVVDLEKVKKVLLIQPYVGMTYPDITENVKAVLFLTYHSGTLNTSSKYLEQFCEECRMKNVKLYLNGLELELKYESVKKYEELGIEVMPVQSPISSYMKLWMQ